jgi:TetR/AcrR family transcriptional repressor of nem operon
MARPKTFDDDAVLDRALQLFRQRGYEGTSMADLEAHLRLGRQSLYNTFGDKQALYLKALERYQRQTSDTLRSVLDAPDAGLDALRRWLAMHTASLTAPGERAGCFVVNSVVERPQDTATVARCTGAREQLLNLVRATLVRARARGEIAAGHNVDALAQLILSHAYGLAVLARAGASVSELRAASEVLVSALQ